MTDPQTVESPSVVWATAEHSSCARHKNYMLSCEQFDELLERAGGHCEICGMESRPEIKGCCLHIDHEHFVGQWAVRGLLCYVCNLSMRSNRRITPDPRIRQYVSNSWYVQQLEKRGLSEDPASEPGVGSRITTPKRSWARFTDETETCWISFAYNTTKTATWRQIWYQYGPLGMRILEIRDTASKYLISEVRKQSPYVFKQLKNTTPVGPQSREISEERIAVARGVIASHGWHESDREAIADLEAALAGTSRLRLLGC